MDGLFDSIFISGRGEVASRIARTCRRVGIDVVDAELPPATHPLQPDAEATVAAAQASNAAALHPGYVGPRARAELAFLSRAAGLTFVGPSNEALAVMADKVALRRRAEEAGLTPLPGSEALSTWEETREAADELDFPLFVKPVAGTAGFGVLEIDDPDDLHTAFDISVERAGATFGDARIYLEHALRRPRHLEVTVVADAHGNSTALRERDSSVQRRHQVLIAETPSPWLNNHGEGEAIREFLTDQALRLAEELSLVGVFTVEFLIDADDRVFFLEANADMQGAVLVTEMATGRDPIELALQTAAGLALVPDPSLSSGHHAFEVRVCAEDPDDAFRRTPGTVEEMTFPAAPLRRVRIESAVGPGEEPLAGIEPLLCRIGAVAPGRHDALHWLDRVLAEAKITGVENNITFLRQVLNHDSFRAGAYDTSFTKRIQSE